MNAKTENEITNESCTLTIEPTDQIGTHTKILHTDSEKEYWQAVVYIVADSVTDVVSVEMNVDTIICKREGETFKTYAWPKNVGRVEAAATIVALSYIAGHCGRL